MFEAALLLPAGEEGRNLSGGQAHRLAIARALLMQTPILLMDEPTTGLGRDDVAHVEETINHLAASTGQTVLFITHDFSITDSADFVLVLAGGRLAETGSHAALLAKKGTYSQLARRAE